MNYTVQQYLLAVLLWQACHFFEAQYLMKDTISFYEWPAVAKSRNDQKARPTRHNAISQRHVLHLPLAHNICQPCDPYKGPGSHSIIGLPARSTHPMTPQKRHSGRSFGKSSSLSIEWSTPPPSPTTQRLAERFRLPDGTTAHRVPAPCHLHDRTIPFNDNGNPGILVKDILNGGCVQDSPEHDFKAGSLKIVFQWPGYDSSDILHARHITVNPNTIQELAVALCSALHKFYLCASKIRPSVESVPWALFSRVRLGDIMLTSIYWDAGVWVPEFYVLRK
ncbi:hypothetical protein EV702DRAFT_1078599 [Suillus placidus]|uniref:Uncharacterized protein n=1 Tax=Suillus placidus TaxID=48579 RepID=A0A9P7A134_9AGAM|nr:hypothetical protein EV702DRAFT_1078599 [Suillus placidus]